VNATKKIKAPKFAWVVFDPAGKSRSVFLVYPSNDACAWIYAADQPGRSGLSIETPRDTRAALNAGYRVKRCRLTFTDPGEPS